MNEIPIISITTEKEHTDDKINEIKDKVKLSNPSAIIYLMDGCPHCVDLKNLLKEVEPEIKKHKSKGGLIAKLEQKFMDLVDVENRDIDGFPTLIISQNGKQIKKYDGERTKEGIIKFFC